VWCYLETSSTLILFINCFYKAWALKAERDLRNAVMKRALSSFSSEIQLFVTLNKPLNFSVSDFPPLWNKLQWGCFGSPTPLCVTLLLFLTAKWRLSEHYVSWRGTGHPVPRLLLFLRGVPLCREINVFATEQSPSHFREDADFPVWTQTLFFFSLSLSLFFFFWWGQALCGV